VTREQLEDALVKMTAERDEACADLARLGGPDPNEGLWAELLAMAGLPEGTLKAIVVGVIRQRLAHGTGGTP